MTIRYDGSRATSTKSRMAMIRFDEKTEEELVEKTVDFLHRIKGWNGFDYFDECVVIGMTDREEYDEFLADYKEAKSMIKNCMF